MYKHRKMKQTSKAIREKIGETKESLDGLDTLLTSEDRDFTEAEKTLYDEKMAELTRLVDELPKAEKQEEIRLKAASLAGTPVAKPEERELDREVAKNFSFGDAVRAAYGVERLEGFAKEMNQEGEKEMRSIGQSSSGIVIPAAVLNRAVITENGTTGVEAQGFVQSVYANTILSNLGVTRISTSTDQRVPIIGAVTTQWEGETDNAADGGSATTKVDLTPKRLASFVDFSKQAAMQSNYSIEGALRDAFAQSLGAKVEYAVFTDDTANGSYEWLGNGKTPVDAGNMTDLVLALMEQIQDNNHSRGNLGFAISNDLFSLMYTAAQISGVNPLVVNDMIMGKKAEFSNQIAAISTKPVAYYGDWSKFQMVQFGGIEILTDNVTQAIGGKTRLVLNSYWDAALIQDAAISVGTYTA